MPKFITPIVGAAFRPPAKAVLSALAGGTALRLIREPENPYDQRAIRVEASPKDLVEAIVLTDDFKLMLAGYGFDLEALHAQAFWHLGYVPKTHNTEPASLMDAQAQKEPPTLTAKVFEGKLSFNAAGAPQVEFSL